MGNSKWIICQECSGDGHHAKAMGEINRDEWEVEEFERYMAGAYDKTCDLCGGDGKMLRADLKAKRAAKAAREPWWMNDPVAMAERRLGA